MSHAKTVFRTIFYQLLLIFTGLSIGFIINAEYVGFKSPVLGRSINNIFFPIEFDEDVLVNLKKWGAMQLWILNGEPYNFEIIEEAVLAEEWYWAKFKYRDENKIERIKIDSVRIRWKPWEYYYDNDAPTIEELNEYIKNGDLNSRESDKAFKLRNEKIEREKNKEPLDK